jgi:hypothetical protein
LIASSPRSLAIACNLDKGEENEGKLANYSRYGGIIRKSGSIQPSDRPWTRAVSAAQWSIEVERVRQAQNSGKKYFSQESCAILMATIELGFKNKNFGGFSRGQEASKTNY